jgi:3-deoxy-7-phosphoheptulonate synthase
VLEVIHVTQPYKQVSREWREEPTVIELPNGTVIGGGRRGDGGPLLGGVGGADPRDRAPAPGAGATVLRGGAFKPRTSPYSFQGMGVEGLSCWPGPEETGMAIVTEALDPEGSDLVAEYADIIQIGARNMQNYPLLRAGRTGKAGPAQARDGGHDQGAPPGGEYILAEGNDDVILCERGVRSFDTTPATCST